MFRTMARDGTYPRMYWIVYWGQSWMLNRTPRSLGASFRQMARSGNHRERLSCAHLFTVVHFVNTPILCSSLLLPACLSPQGIGSTQFQRGIRQRRSGQASGRSSILPTASTASAYATLRPLIRSAERFACCRRRLWRGLTTSNQLASDVVNNPSRLQWALRLGPGPSRPMSCAYKRCEHASESFIEPVHRNSPVWLRSFEASSEAIDTLSPNRTPPCIADQMPAHASSASSSACRWSV